MVIDKLKFTITPPLKVKAETSSDLMLNCKAQGSTGTIWKRVGQSLPQNHVLYFNGTLLLRNLKLNDAGSYKCVAGNAQRSIEAISVVDVAAVPVQWLHYMPQWCYPYRRSLKSPATLEQCKQACLSGCAAIEYWPVAKACNECLDHTKRTPYTDTSDSFYPPHVYIKQ